MAISDFDSKTFRPRVGGRGGQIKPQRVPTFRSTVIARIQQRIRRIAGPKPAGASARKRHPTAGFYGDAPTVSSRRCIVKARIVRMAGRGIKAARLHLSYIERDGVERDGSKGELYGDSERTFKRERLAAELSKEAHQFRFIVSPEDGAELDLREFTRSLMKEVETDLGRRLIWGAVNHHDTDNPHVHIVVRGVDLDGHPLRIDREYITQGMRWRAQEVATLELGPRDIRHIERQRNREIGQERLTNLDRDLARLINDTARVLTFIAEPQSGFRGTLVPCPGPGPGRDTRYVAILDERGRRFTVVPDFGGSGLLRGQVVELGLGEDGRFLVKRRELSRGR
jgi:hypothetical protein